MLVHNFMLHIRDVRKKDFIQYQDLMDLLGFGPYGVLGDLKKRYAIVVFDSIVCGLVRYTVSRKSVLVIYDLLFVADYEGQDLEPLVLEQLKERHRPEKTVVKPKRPRWDARPLEESDEDG
jgi:hypothetical protein